MMIDNLEKYGDMLELDVDASREPDLGYRTNWVYEARNQTSLLEGFAAHLRHVSCYIEAILGLWLRRSKTFCAAGWVRHTGYD